MMDKEICVMWARRAMFFLALIGLFVSSYLFVTYTSGTPIVCGVAHGCDVVRASRWATMFGLPTPLFGIIFYTAVAALLIIRTIMPSYKTALLFRLTRLAVFIGLAESAYLTYIQAFTIGAYCSWCLASAVTATLLFVVAFWDRRHVLEAERMAKELKIQFFGLLVTAIVGIIVVMALLAPRTDGERPQLRAYEPDAETEALAAGFLYPEGLTVEGPEDAPVTITEFIDFECPSCAAAHPELHKVRKEYEGRIRFAYRQFPLPMHRHAKEAAIAAVCADAQGTLFPYADVLVEGREHLEREDLVGYAAELRLDMDAFASCLESREALERVEQDLHDGDALGVSATPTIFINTSMIDGLPNAEQLGELIDQILE